MNEEAEETADLNKSLSVRRVPSSAQFAQWSFSLLLSLLCTLRRSQLLRVTNQIEISPNKKKNPLYPLKKLKIPQIWTNF